MSTAERFPMTRQGYDKIKQELDFIKSVDRPKNLKDIETATAQGDLSENAEYHAAKEKNAHLNGRLQELEHRLSKADIIDPLKMKGQTKIMFGAHVTLLDVNSEVETTYQIVGEHESDIAQGKISVTSPIAKAVIGKSKEDAVKVKTPKGIKEFEIITVEYK